jgi:hypothetical protein
MEKLTYEQALQIIGEGIAHDSLKLSQKEHLLLIESFKTLKELVEKEKQETINDQLPKK